MATRVFQSNRFHICLLLKISATILLLLLQATQECYGFLGISSTKLLIQTNNPQTIFSSRFVNSIQSSVTLTNLEQDRNNGLKDTDCPPGYYLDSVENSCKPLGPIGRISQAVETFGPFRKAYNSISDLFGIDPTVISNLGVTFALSYSFLSQINGSVTLSIAWYISSKRTGLSPVSYTHLTLPTTPYV